MIKREVFVVKFEGLPHGQEIHEAIEDAVRNLNTWKAVNAYCIDRIISVQEERFRSDSSDLFPAWVKLIVFYESK